jgi:hypothetical protein
MVQRIVSTLSVPTPGEAFTAVIWQKTDNAEALWKTQDTDARDSLKCTVGRVRTDWRQPAGRLLAIAGPRDGGRPAAGGRASIAATSCGGGGWDSEYAC